jgi:YidC/Oxa1 family membrane protein insertase
MEKRVLLAVALSFLVLVVYQSLFVPPRPEPVRDTPVGASPTPSTQAVEPTPAPDGPPSVATPPAAATEPLPPAEPLVADTEVRDVTVDTAMLQAVFSNRGAELTSWKLKTYRTESRELVDLVPANLPEEEPRAFALLADDPALTRRLREARFRPSTTTLDVAAGSKRLTFDYQDGAGLDVRKQFDFESRDHPYLVAFSAEVRLNGQALPVRISSGPGLGDTERAVGSSSFLVPGYYQKPQAIFARLGDGSAERVLAMDLAKQPEQSGRFLYLGADDHYFLGAVLPGDRALHAVYRALSMPAPGGAEGVRDLVVFESRVDGPVEGLEFYLGPKHFDTLAVLGTDFTRIVHFGIFAWLVVPLLRALNWVHGFAGNYGWSIIILTIFINAAMFPLRHKSVVSMRKMQELQPEIKAIQERYGKLKTTDPARQKMNTEVMNLYRERGVNPASGCLPMLLTFPVLFAFYSLLSQAIEIRDAPFVGWITDLSTHDPLYVTPILMGATMVWQQKITPSTADPIQQRIMMFMPIMFTFLFLWAPSGLVIYWFTSNVWAIGQQMITNKIIGPPQVKPARPAAERRVKPAGAGKSEQARH